MSKLTKQQRQELKALVANATVRRLTAKETSAFIFEKLGVPITNDYVRRLRMDIKHDYTKELQLLQKDREYYLEQLFSADENALRGIKYSNSFTLLNYVYYPSPELS